MGWSSIIEEMGTGFLDQYHKAQDGWGFTYQGPFHSESSHGTMVAMG